MEQNGVNDAYKQAVFSIVKGAKEEFSQSKGWFLGTLAAVPFDRVHWVPAATARSAIQLAAHTALSVGHMLGNLKGDTFAVPRMDQADGFHREQELALMTIEEINAVFEANTEAYFSWLDALEIDDLRKNVLLPFDLGSVTLPEAIGFMAKHIDWHHAQLQYLQTIYGDRNWY